MSSDVRLSPKERRAILTQLSRERLGELTTQFELDVSDRRSTEAHIDAIVRKRSLDFRHVLEVLRREELQEAWSGIRRDDVLEQAGVQSEKPQIKRCDGEETGAEHERA